MSTRQAVAAVTAALSELVATSISGVLPMTRVTNLRPGVAVADTTKTPSVNVYLYRAEPHAGLRNVADPIRNAAGQLVTLPVAAWKLHYLLTCTAAEEELGPELLLGAVLTGLNATPVLTRGLVAAMDEALANDTGNRRFAAGSGLQDESELVKLTPLALSLGELTDLFRALAADGHYALSTAWEASLVLMSPAQIPRPALPVGGPPRVVVSSLSSPRVVSVFDSRGESAPITIGSRLVIQGERLRADATQVRLGTLDIDIAPGDMTAARIELALSTLPLAPGVLGVQVRQRVNLAEAAAPPDFRPGATSNAIAIVLRPQIVAPVALEPDLDGAASFRVAIAPAPDPSWDYLLLLHELGAGTPRSFALSRSSIDAAHVWFPRAAVPSGDWLVRIRVNGADSVLDRDATGKFVGPKVTVL